MMRARKVVWLGAIVGLLIVAAGCETLPGGKAGGGGVGQVVGVLLPTDDRDFGEAAKAIMAGIQDAATGNPPLQTPTAKGDVLKRFDELAFGETPADVIIGPLLSGDVAKVSKVVGTTKVLLLNKIPPGGPALHAFALAPEDEAETVAHLLTQAGAKRALVIRPDTEWGERLAKRFKERMRADELEYDAEGHIKLGTSKISNADAIFLIASFDNALRLYPTFDNKQAPVIATSHVADAAASARRDARLAGLYFVEIPWLLPGTQQSKFQGVNSGRYRTGDLARLYAMGVDVYRLGIGIADGKSPLELKPKEGMTGEIKLNKGSMTRRLALGKFKPISKSSGGHSVQLAPADPAELNRAVSGSDRGR
jgi:uncharacterized protein